MNNDSYEFGKKMGKAIIFVISSCAMALIIGLTIKVLGWMLF